MKANKAKTARTSGRQQGLSPSLEAAGVPQTNERREAAQGRGTRAGRWRRQVPGTEPELGAGWRMGLLTRGEAEDLYSGELMGDIYAGKGLWT